MAAYRALAPRTPRQIRTQARYNIGATYSPLFAQLNRRESGNQAAIEDYTQRLIQQLGPLAAQTAGYYNRAETQQQGVNTELANRLNSVGGQEAAALQAKLQAAGLPGDQAQRVSAIGSGAANTGAALGSANLSSLLAQGAAQTSYAGKLPGIAALGGLQFAKQNLAQMEQQRGDLQAKEASAIPGELSQLQNLEFQKAAANLGFAGTQQKLAVDVAKTQAGFKYKAAQGRKPDSSLSRTYGHVVDSNGRTIPGPNGKPIPVAKSASAANDPAKVAANRKANFYSVRGKTFTEAGRLFKGTKGSGTGAAGNPLAAPGSSGSSAYTSVPYGTAYKRLWTQYGTQLTQQYGFKRPAVDTMIRRALAHAGYKKPMSQRQAAAQGAAAAAALPGQIGL